VSERIRRLIVGRIGRSVERHFVNIFSKLGLVLSDADHRRVPAMIRYLDY
jgi:hypothetical protein